MSITVIGAGLAGCEAAWQIASKGEAVMLYEMKPKKYSPAHSSEQFAELICSNSFKADRVESAAGLLKEEMRRFHSLLMECADQCRVPAGGALAVDRDRFSQMVTEKIKSNPLIKVVSEEVTEIPKEGITVIATGPLTSDTLAEQIVSLCGDSLSFYDAAAPIVTAESLSMEDCFTASRYDKGGDDAYINCPMNKEEYEAFYEALRTAEPAPLHDFDQAEKRVYEGCMPIEIMARRGPDTIRYGPLKPVGLRNPRTGHRPWAVVQLRRENSAGTLYNLVGFQTNLRFGEQKRVFSMIPGLAHAEFMRYGVMHRNTFIGSPWLLDETMRMREHDRIYFAGQITGVEGYMESAMSGILTGRQIARRLQGKEPLKLPLDCMCGALLRYVSGPACADFQPMGANMGLLPPLDERMKDKQQRYLLIAQRGLAHLRQTLVDSQEVIMV